MLWSRNNEYLASWLSLTISLTVVCTLWLGFHSPQCSSIHFSSVLAPAPVRSGPFPSLGSQWMRLWAWGGVSSPTTNIGHWYFTPAHACTQLQHCHVLNGPESLNGRQLSVNMIVSTNCILHYCIAYFTFSFMRPFLLTSNRTTHVVRFYCHCGVLVICSDKVTGNLWNHNKIL